MELEPQDIVNRFNCRKLSSYGPTFGNFDSCGNASYRCAVPEPFDDSLDSRLGLRIHLPIRQAVLRVPARILKDHRATMSDAIRRLAEGCTEAPPSELRLKLLLGLRLVAQLPKKFLQPSLIFGANDSQ